MDEFILKDGVLTVRTKNGNSLTAPIFEVEVEYADVSNEIFTIKRLSKKLTFIELPGMLSYEECTELEETVESFPNYGLSTLGAIIKTLGITIGFSLR